MRGPVTLLLVGLALGGPGGTWARADAVVAAEQLEAVRAHYQADELKAMAGAAMAGLEALGEGDHEPKLRGSLWYWAAVSQQMLGDYPTALAHYERALAVHENAGNRREVAATLNSYAGVLGMSGRQTERLAALVKAHDIFEALGESQGRAAVAQSIGNYYAELEDFTAAQPYYEQSVAIRRGMENPGYLADGLMGLGVNLRLLERGDEGRAALEEALAIFRESGDEGGLAGVLTNLGNLERVERRFDAALAAYREALGYDEGAGYKYGVAILKHNLALTFLEMDELDRAGEWADQAVAAAAELGDAERTETAYRLRAQVREARGEFAGAMADLRSLMEVQAQRSAAAREEALLDLQTRFETAQKERAIEQLERAAVERELELTREAAAREAAEQAQEIEQARSRTALVLAISAVVAALILAGLVRVNRRAAHRLARQREEIEHAVAGLREAHTELKKLYDQKSKFLSFAAHDLRSPLYAIDAVCGEIEGGLLDSPVAGVGEIRGAARHMREELDAWLDAERREQTEVTVHPVSSDLGQLATEVVALNQPAARAKGVTLELLAPEPGPVRVDPWRMREVIDNFVSNAIKYTPRDSRVTVTTGVREGRAYVRVADQGPGLSPEDRERLFGAYARLSAQPTGGETSTGLGLHLCKRIVDAHAGGAITVEDAPGGGAIFEVSVPVAAA